MYTFKSSALYMGREGNGCVRLATLMMSTPRGIPGAGRPKRVLFARGITAGGPAPAGPGSFIARTSKKCVSN